jgi:hypothetical protein
MRGWPENICQTSVLHRRYAFFPHDKSPHWHARFLRASFNTFRFSDKDRFLQKTVVVSSVGTNSILDEGSMATGSKSDSAVFFARLALVKRTQIARRDSRDAALDSPVRVR